jgi:hypothetical protein
MHARYASFVLRTFIYNKPRKHSPNLAAAALLLLHPTATACSLQEALHCNVWVERVAIVRDCGQLFLEQ